MSVIGKTSLNYRLDAGEIIVDAMTKDFGRMINYSLATIEVGADSDTVVAPMGLAVYWDDANSRFAQYATGVDISAITGSPLQGGSPVALVIGDNRGYGINIEDVTIGTTNVYMTALYRGDAAVMYDKVDFGDANAAEIAAFKAQMFAQGIIEVTRASTSTNSYVQ